MTRDLIRKTSALLSPFLRDDGPRSKTAYKADVTNKFNFWAEVFPGKKRGIPGVIQKELPRIRSQSPISPRVSLAIEDRLAVAGKVAPDALVERCALASARCNFPYNYDSVIERNRTENGYPSPDYKMLSEDTERFFDEKNWLQPGDVLGDAGSGPLAHFAKAVRNRGTAAEVHAFDPASRSPDVKAWSIEEAAEALAGVKTREIVHLLDEQLWSF